MDPRRNPFSPGAGVRPAQLAGREDLIETAEIAMDRVLGGLHATDIIMTGLRGVGKTVLLNHLVTLAKAKGMETIKFEVPDARGGHLTPAMVIALGAVLKRLDRLKKAGEGLKLAAAALQNFAAVFRVKYEGFSFGAEPARALADSGDLETDLPELLMPVARAAGARRSAIVLFIDEVQYLTREELSALARACHEAAQQGVPFLFIGAGLPQIAALAGEAKSYAERLFLYPAIGALSPQAAREALRAPARQQGADFTDEALERILEETERYPYFLQTWGKFTWDAAGESPITEDDVAAAGPSIIAHLDQNFFRVRFDRCTELEQQYLRAMAELGPGPHRTGDIAAALSTTSTRLAPVRRSLISAGMIYSPRYGETGFTVPLFDGFMKRMLPTLEPYKPKRRTGK